MEIYFAFSTKHKIHYMAQLYQQNCSFTAPILSLVITVPSVTNHSEFSYMFIMFGIQWGKYSSKWNARVTTKAQLYITSSCIWDISKNKALGSESISEDAVKASYAQW